MTDQQGHADRDAQRAELLAWVRQVRRERRDAKVRAGRVMPRTYREAELFAADLIDKSDRQPPEQQP